MWPGLPDGPVGADRTSRPHQRRQMLLHQRLHARLSRMNGHIHRRPHCPGPIPHRHRHRPDPPGQLIIGQRPSLRPHIPQNRIQLRSGIRHVRRDPRPTWNRQHCDTSARSNAAKNTLPCDVGTTGNRVSISTRSAMILGTATRATYTMSLPSSCVIDDDSPVRRTRSCICGRATSHNPSAPTYAMPRSSTRGVSRKPPGSLRTSRARPA